MQLIKLWQVVNDDIGLIGMQCQIVLVIVFGGIKFLQWHDLCDNRRRISVRGSKLSDVALCCFLLFNTGVKYC